MCRFLPDPWCLSPSQVFHARKVMDKYGCPLNNPTAACHVRKGLLGGREENPPLVASVLTRLPWLLFFLQAFAKFDRLIQRVYSPSQIVSCACGSLRRARALASHALGSSPQVLSESGAVSTRS